MNFRTTGILAIVLAAVGVFFYFATRDSAPNPDAAKTEQTTDDSKGSKLFDVKADDLDKLDISSADGSQIALSKSAGQWKLSKPVDWPADRSEVDRLLSAITDLRSRGHVELNSSNSASTGLDHPRFLIDASGAGHSLKLEVGSRAALGSNLYVKTGTAGQAELVSAGTLGENLAKGLPKLVASLRDKQLVTLSEPQVRQVRIERRSGRLVVDKTGEEWKVQQPAAVAADTSEATSLLDPITGLRATDFSDESAAEQAGAQFDKPRLVVWLSSSAPATQPASGPAAPTSAPANLENAAKSLQGKGGVTVVVGQPVDIDAQKAWVKVYDPARPPVVAQAQLTQAVYDQLNRASPLSLRDKKVLDIDFQRVSGFTVAIDRPATTQPTTRPAELREFAIERRKIAAPILGPALPGGAPPATQPSSSSESATPSTATAAQLPAAATGPAVPSTQPATTPATTPSTAPAATTAPATAPAAASPATEPSSPWIFASGGQGPAEEGQVNALLDALHPLRAQKYLEKSPTTQPAATYTLTVRSIPAKAGESAEEVVVRFTDSDKPGGPVIASYKDLIFEVDRGLLDKLSGDFKTRKPPAAPPPSFPGVGGMGGMPFGGQ